jgi:hypothetical protein
MGLFGRDTPYIPFVLAVWVHQRAVLSPRDSASALPDEPIGGIERPSRGRSPVHELSVAGTSLDAHLISIAGRKKPSPPANVSRIEVAALTDEFDWTHVVQLTIFQRAIRS